MTSTTARAIIDSGGNFSTITEEIAKRLGLKINRENHSSRNVNSVVSSLRSQVLNKKIQISLHQLLEIVKPEVRQDIIKVIANPVTPKRKCKVRRNKTILSYSSSSSESGSGCGSESSSDGECT